MPLNLITLINNLLVKANYSGIEALAPKATPARYFIIEHNRCEHKQLLKSFLLEQAPQANTPHILFAFSDGSKTLRDQITELLSQAKKSHQQIEIVPVTIYHGRLPKRAAKGFEGGIGSESWQHPSILRRTLQLLSQGRNTFVEFKQPTTIVPSAFSDTNAAVDELSNRFKKQFRNDRKAVVGPDLSHRRTLIRKIINSAEVQDQIAKQVKDGGNYQELHQQSLRTLDTIAANFNPKTAHILNRILDWLCPRMFSNIHIRNMAPVKQLAPSQQLVFLPCHRSHFDYVLLSWALHKQGLMLPHVAAGENLNIPVIGPILKQGGAIFMRRSFKGDPLYKTLYKAYLAQMTQLGHSLEYYIEGGRSRTGRLLPPKPGLLSITLDNYYQNPQQPVTLVPVWIGYDRLPESHNYSKELSGANKTPESLNSALSNIRRLKQVYGEVSLNFGEPLSLQPHRELDTYTVAQSLMSRINAAATPSRSALLGTVLFAQNSYTTPLDTFAEQVDKLRNFISQSGYDVPDGSAKSWLSEFTKMGLLHVEQQQILVTEAQRQEFSFYRNQIQHLLIISATLVFLLQRIGPLSSRRFDRIINTLYPFFSAELFLPQPAKIKQLVTTELDRLSQQGCIDKTGNKWQLASDTNPINSTLIHCCEPTLARYYLILKLLERNPTILKDELIEASRELALQLHLKFGFRSPEYGAKEIFTSFISRLVSEKMLNDEDGKLTVAVNLSYLFKQAEALLLPQLLTEIKRLVNLKN